MGKTSETSVSRNRAVYLAWCSGRSYRDIGREFDISFQRVAQIVVQIEKNGPPPIRYDYKRGRWEFADAR